MSTRTDLRYDAVNETKARTLDAVLRSLGADHPGGLGPLAVVTILRMFDVSRIEEVFEDHGFAFGAVPGVRLPQRRFVDDRERLNVVELLHERGIDTAGLEDGGKQYADLFVAARGEAFSPLVEEMLQTRSRLETASEALGYIRR